MDLTDPATGTPLPADAIQRIMFICSNTHVYNIPPLQSTVGHRAADWTADPKRHIFSARLRIIETDLGGSGDDNSQLKTDVVLEDPSTGQLFAAAPYTSANTVEPVVDSSRFFAVRVQDPSGRKAMLGIGFEERSDAFDFSVALQEARRALGMEASAGGTQSGPGKDQGGVAKKEEDELKRDLSLKEGETITVNLGGKFGRKREPSKSQAEPPAGASLNSFALPPPPGSGSGGFGLSPPPRSQDVRAERRLSRGLDKNNAKALGFDDGQFGEFA